MKKKMRTYPYPVLLCVAAFIYFALIGEDRLLVPILAVSALVLGLWYLFAPYVRPPVSSGAYLNPAEAEAQRISIQEQQRRWTSSLASWAWEYNMHTNREFRDKNIAAALTMLLAGVIYVFFGEENVILWRTVLIAGVCVLAILWLLTDALVLRLRRKREERDRSSYPLPTVNMTFDEGAVADGRAQALETRLRQLEEWRQSGMISDGEFESLRKRYLKRHEVTETANPGEKRSAGRGGPM